MKDDGFTLVELVIVVLILGILAAIASSKVCVTHEEAQQVSAQTSLSTLREAIGTYRLQNSEWPGQSGGQAGFKADLKPLLRGPFPTCQVGNLNSDVTVTGSPDPLSPSGPQGWRYSKVTGQFIINHADYATW